MTTLSLRALRPPALATTPRGEARRRARELLESLREGFVPDSARGVDAVIEWRVDTGDEMERFQLTIRGGRCTLRRRAAQPAVTISLGIEDLHSLVERRIAPARLFLSQRLSVSGDVLMATRLPHFFHA